MITHKTPCCSSTHRTELCHFQNWSWLTQWQKQPPMTVMSLSTCFSIWSTKWNSFFQHKFCDMCWKVLEWKLHLVSYFCVCILHLLAVPFHWFVCIFSDAKCSWSHSYTVTMATPTPLHCSASSGWKTTSAENTMIECLLFARQFCQMVRRDLCRELNMHYTV